MIPTVRVGKEKVLVNNTAVNFIINRFQHLPLSALLYRLDSLTSNYNIRLVTS